MASKSYRKFMATGLSAAVVASVVAPVAGAASYTDVKAGSWYEDAVNYVTEAGYMQGTGVGFEPESKMTRAQAAQLFTNIFGIADENLTEDFSDVSEKNWYHGAVAAVLEHGIMNGMGNGKFAPEANLTRGQMAAIVVRAYELEDHEGSGHSFTDIEGHMFEKEIAILADLGLIDGMGDGSFAPDAHVTRAQMAQFIYNMEAPVFPAVESVEAVDATTLEVTVDGSWTQEEVDALIATGEYELTVEGEDATHTVGKVTVKTAEASASEDTTTLVLSEISPELAAGEFTLAINGYAVEGTEFKYEAPATPEVSASAVGAKKLEVKFNKAVDTEKAKVTLKKGTSNIGLASVTFSEDKKSAILDLNGKLSEGTYTVSVEGLTGEALTSEVKVENEKVAGVELLSDNALITETNTVQVGYKVVNQYGENITSSTAMYDLVYNATSGYTVTSVDSGKATLVKTGAKAGDTFTLTLIDSKSANSTSKIVTVSDKAMTSDVVFSGIYNAKGSALNEDNKAESFFLTINAKDQYGNAVTNLAKLEDDLIVTVSNPAVLGVKDVSEAAEVQEFTTYEDADKKKHTAIALDPKTAGESIITVVSKSNGKAVSYKVTVDSGVKLDVVTLGAPNGLVAGGDTFLVPLSIADNKGNAITDASKVDGKLTFSGSGYDAIKVVSKEGSLYAEVTATETVTQTSLVITVKSQTEKYDTEVVTVKPTATAKAVIGLKSNVSSSIYADQKLSLEAKHFVVQDQYGREMDTTSEDFTATIVASDNTEKSTVSVSGLEITAGSAKGTEAVTFELDGVTNSSTDVTFRVVDRSEFVSYEVADISKLYANGTIGGTAEAPTAPSFDYEDDYATELVVNGITADGKKVQLPSSEFTVYETSAYVGYNGGVLDAVQDTDRTKTFEGSVNLIVTINETGQELTKQVVVSEATPKVAKVEAIVNSKAVTTLDYDISEDLTPGFDSTDIAGLLKVTDTYGVTNASLAVVDRVTFSNIVDKAGNDLDINVNGTASANLSSLAVGDTFDATMVVGGQSLKLAVTVK
jgi:trimeric autotransporter adhesin